MKTPHSRARFTTSLRSRSGSTSAFTACAPYSSFTLPTSLASTTATPSACSALTHLWFTLPYSRRLACRPPARQPHGGNCRALLMTLGHVVLGVESTSAWSLYVALAIIICGYGLFKSISAACSANCTLTTTRVATAVSRCCTPPATSARLPRPSPADWRRSGTAGISASPLRGSVCLSA